MCYHYPFSISKRGNSQREPLFSFTLTRLIIGIKVFFLSLHHSDNTIIDRNGRFVSVHRCFDFKQIILTFLWSSRFILFYSFRVSIPSFVSCKNNTIRIQHPNMSGQRRKNSIFQLFTLLNNFFSFLALSYISSDTD